MATIEDVARIAGVSTATVSRVLNNANTVSEKTTKKVRDAVEKTGYHMNILGSALRANRTRTVLVILSTILNSFYAKVVQGVEDVAEKNGYRILIGTNYDSADREDAYLSLVRNRLADGVILMRPSISPEALSLLDNGFPVVQCDGYIPHTAVPGISIDNRAATCEMTSHLIEKGHRRIALLRASDGYAVGEERFRGYLDALCKHQIPYSPARVLEGNYGYRNAKTVVASYLQTEVPDAIFALSDRMAAGAVAALSEAGLSVPGDVSVVGFDNLDLSYIVSPPLTTISQNQYQMGALAMETLIARMEGKTAESRRVPYEIKWRDSVKDRK